MAALCLLGVVDQTTSAPILLLGFGSLAKIHLMMHMIMLPQLMSSCHLKGATPLEMCCLWGEKHKGITPLIEMEVFYFPPRGRRYFVITLPLPPNCNTNL